MEEREIDFESGFWRSVRQEEAKDRLYWVKRGPGARARAWSVGPGEAGGRWAPPPGVK